MCGLRDCICGLCGLRVRICGLLCFGRFALSYFNVQAFALCLVYFTETRVPVLSTFYSMCILLHKVGNAHLAPPPPPNMTGQNKA